MVVTFLREWVALRLCCSVWVFAFVAPRVVTLIRINPIRIVAQMVFSNFICLRSAAIYVKSRSRRGSTFRNRWLTIAWIVDVIVGGLPSGIGIVHRARTSVPLALFIILSLHTLIFTFEHLHAYIGCSPFCRNGILVTFISLRLWNFHLNWFGRANFESLHDDVCAPLACSGFGILRNIP